jgi:lambda repressor-like predicted transcriptional regulator
MPSDVTGETESPPRTLLEAAIRERGRSLRSVAEASGLSVSTLHRGVTGQYPLRINDLGRVAEALGVHISALIDEVPA